jgi:hypothetical protein
VLPTGAAFIYAGAYLTKEWDGVHTFCTYDSTSNKVLANITNAYGLDQTIDAYNLKVVVMYLE